MNRNISIKGQIEIVRMNENNKIDDMWTFDNIIVDTGFDFIRRIIGGDRPGINRIGLGTGGGIASPTDTKLLNKIILVNVGKDYSIGNNKVKFQAFIPENTFNETVYFLEGGLFYKSVSEEIMISRVVFPDVIYQKPQNSLSISYSISLS